MTSPDLLRGLVQIPSPGIVAKPGPMVQHCIQGGFSQVIEIRKTLHETLEIGDHGSHLSLLEHNLRDPDPIGGRILLPGEVFAAGTLVPIEYQVGKFGLAGHRLPEPPIPLRMIVRQ